METVFVKTRWHYQSYTDYWRMVEIAGYPMCYIDEVDIEAERVYVVCPLNGEWELVTNASREESKERRAILISWTIEPPTRGNYLPNLRKQVVEGIVDWVWLAYRNLAEAAGHPRIVFVPVGSSAMLGNALNNERRYDVVHICSATNRRRRLFEKLLDKGVRLAPSGWGKERDAALRASKFLLNVHKEAGFSAHEPLRFAVAAAYGLPIISETCEDPHPYEPGIDFYQADYDQLADTVLAALAQDHEPWAEMGLNTQVKMTDGLGIPSLYSFEGCIGQALQTMPPREDWP